MITLLGLVLLGLAALPAALTLMNINMLRVARPKAPAPGTLVSILIPARNEADTIEGALDAALASAGVPIEVVVMDDGSTDGTAALVEAFVRRDPRVKLHAAPPLEEGWTGKVHACHRLSEVAYGTHLLFVDADVRLSRHAAATLAGRAQESGAALVSAVPRQITKSLGELLTVPMINFLLIAYLPIGFMRLSRDPGLGAACGQMLLVEREDYRRAGGHAAIRHLLHDGIQLARHFRRRGLMTDLVGGESLASCRMYDSFGDAWAGFSKNAHEGMATPAALPVWTILLLGAHVMPFVLLPIAPTWPVAIAASLSLATRAAITIATRENLLEIPLHPLTVIVGLMIQWSSLLRISSKRTTGWKGRFYPVG